MKHTYTPIFTALLNLGFVATTPAALNDTGITTCSDATQNDLVCPVAGFLRQDGDFGRDVTANDDSDGHAGFSFTKLDANGNELPATATNHSCVKDNVTGLIWEVKTDDGGLHDKDNTYTWDGTGQYVQDVNTAGLCGAKDWRMPDPKELASIVDYSIAWPNPTIDVNYFPNQPSSDSLSSYVWSSSPSADHSGFAWIVYFSNGYVSYGYRYGGFGVRLVRLGQWLLPFAFQDNGDGTISDKNTGLMWSKCLEGLSGNDCATGEISYKEWSGALQAAKNSNLGGYSDWRIPNIKELQSIVDYSRYWPAIDNTYFPNTPSSDVWSSSPYADDLYNAWVVHFGSGDVYGSLRGNGSGVRLVRDAQMYSLTVIRAGNGKGTVSSNPGGINNCSGTCGATFAGTVILTATPETGTTFAGWSGAGTAVQCGTALTCTVTMNTAKTVYATFKTVNKAVNFVITGITFNPVAPNANSTFNVDVTVKNSGSIVADGGQLTLWSNRAAAATCGLNGDQFQAVGSLAAGASKTLTFTGLNAGIHGVKTLRAFVDGNCETPEANESDNQYTKSYRVDGGQPDLVITGITLNPSSPAHNAPFTASVTVKNQGTVSAIVAFLDVWMDQPIARNCEDAGDKYADLTGTLAVGASKTINFSIPASAAGNKTLRAFVDSWCETDELDETNNQFTKSYTVN